MAYRRKNRQNTRLKKVKQFTFFRNIWFQREFYVFLFFCFLFFVIVIRLFWLQVIKQNYFQSRLNSQHFSESLLKAERWDIYAYDNSENPVKLTENMTMYNIIVDPYFLKAKNKSIQSDLKKEFINELSPIVYSHLCEFYWLNKVNWTGCIQNIETFSKREILPKEPEFFYLWDNKFSSGYYDFNWTWFYDTKNQIIENFTSWEALNVIRNTLDNKINIGERALNYLWFFDNIDFVDDIKENIDSIQIVNDFYIYIDPKETSSKSKDSTILKAFLAKYWYDYSDKMIDNLFEVQENRYVKITTNVNSYIIQKIRALKDKYNDSTWLIKIPIVYGLSTESYDKRYYPYWNFLSNVLWYVNNNEISYNGVEQYFDNILRGKDGVIKWRASSRIWAVGANEFEVEDTVDGKNIYLTIDVWIQKEIEAIAQKWQQEFKADSISILVYDPFNGYIKWSVSSPSFDPNNYNSAYSHMPLTEEYSYIIDNETYVDIPIYFYSGDKLKEAKSYERNDPTIEKYIAQNIYWPWVFIDKNVASAYEPGSIFKPFTVAIGIDEDEISPYDFYNDPGKVKVWIYTIKNADNENCMWEHSFLHALIYSCNVGMVRIIQTIWKNGFYNYLNKFGFGQLTNIELMNEDAGSLENPSSVSLARFLNNSFGQWILATPLQVAAWYWALINGGYYVKPTIVAWIEDNTKGLFYENKKKIIRQILKPETTEQIKDALFEIMETNKDYINNMRISWYTLWGKSWTSQIAYKWKYQEGNGRTNGSFVWIITKENPQYIVIVQVRRPRTIQRWSSTAGKVFKEVASFLINYSFIEK